MARNPSQKPHPWLSQLRRHHGLREFNSTGVWEERDAGEIASLADALDDGGVDSEVHGIPSAWARPLSLADILRLRTDPRRAATIAEWRGLLALLALRDARGLPLKLLSVNLPAKDRGGRLGRSTERSEAGAFIDSVSSLYPKLLLDEQFRWHMIRVMMLEEEVVGITSPATFVCPAAEYDLSRDARVSWCVGGRLVDPVRFISPRERGVVQEWLQRLLAAAQSAGASKSAWSTLAGLALEFQSDLRRAGSHARVHETPIEFKHSLLECLESPIDTASDRKGSDVWLKGDRGNSRAVLVLPELEGSGTARLGDLTFWNSTSVALADRLRRAKDVPGPASADQPECWGVTEFFENALILVRQTDAFPGVRPIEGMDVRLSGYSHSALAPVRPRVLTYLSPAQITRRLTLQTGASEVVATLRVTVHSDGSTGEQDFLISRRYTVDSIVIVDSVPVLEIWPDFDRADWQLYYLYQQADPNLTFTAAALGRPDQAAAEPEFREEGLPAGHVIRVSRQRTFPEVLVCQARWRQAQGLLFPLPRQPKPATAGRHWTVGVDFGTSGTVVYRRDEQRDEARGVDFPCRMLHITSIAPAQSDLIRDHFIPAEDVPHSDQDNEAPNSHPSVFIEREGGAAASEIRALLDGHTPLRPSIDRFNPNVEGVFTDLKWGGRDDLLRSRAFHEQLCLHIAAEAVWEGVTGITWRFAFPAAFSSDDSGRLLSIWEDMVRFCVDYTGIKAEPLKMEEPIAEGLAVAKYFSEHHRALFTRGVVFIDIGGASSDIAIWQDNNALKLHSSVRFAARDIFIEPLREYPQLLKDIIDSGQPPSFANKRTRERRHAFYSALEIFLRVEGETLLRNVLNNPDNARLRRFLTSIQIGLAGLLYYIGMLIRFARDSGRLTGARTAEAGLSLPHIYFGGSGSKLLHWACEGRYRTIHPFVEVVMRKVFAAACAGEVDASEQPPAMDFGIYLSTLPKAEVALGLVSDVPVLGNFGMRAVTLAGERFHSGGGYAELHEADKRIDADLVKRGLRVAPELQHLRKFHQLLGLPYPPARAREIAERIQQQLTNEGLKDTQAIHADSLFLVGVKICLELLLRDGEESGSDEDVKTA